MPRGDGTGPSGMGPMTGRAAGYCAGYDAPGFVTGGSGRGYGRGFGPGRGRGFRGAGYRRGYGPGYGRPAGPGPWAGGVAPQPWTEPRPEQEAQALKNEATYLGQQLEAIKARLAELENSSDGE